MAVVEGKERESRQSYWDKYWLEESTAHTIEGMLFDNQAAEIDREDRPEVLSILPSYEGKSVLEMGAGIGRFTGEFAKKAGELLTVETIECLLRKNESNNGHHKNVKFSCSDVSSPDFDFPPESFDVVFSSWLLLYLNDEETKDLARRMLKWAKVGGHIFFRESCFRGSGDRVESHPAYYRHPRSYHKIFKDCHFVDDSGNSYELSLVNFKCIGAYVKMRNDPNQICWLWQKVRSGDDRGFLKFLDKSSKVLQRELAFGEGFLSSGGIDATREFVAKLDLHPGQNVLDVGCGTGGADFYMVDKYGVHVVGVDVSVDMITIALERALGRKRVVEFGVADITKKEYPPSTYDAIYCRETILYIQDKPALLRSFYKWLKPGGRILITSYCKTAGSPSEGFAKYLTQEGYDDVQEVEAYEQMLKDAGFDEIIAEDQTEQFVNNYLQKELENLEKNKATFIKDISEEDYSKLVGGLKSELKWGVSGELRCSLFIAKKK